MTFANVNIGTAPGYGDGDPLRNAFDKINKNFANAQISFSDISLTAPVQTVAGKTGDVILSVNDIAGAASTGYVNGLVTAANTAARAYTDSAISSLDLNVPVHDSTKANLAGDTFTGVVRISNSTHHTTANTGAFIIPTGGAYIGGNLHTRGTVFIGLDAVDQSVFNALGVFRGPPTYVNPDALYTQLAIINASNNTSADVAVYTDNGNDSAGWTDMGIAGTAFSDPEYTITKPQDGYLFTKPNDVGAGGNLVIATSNAGTYNDIVFGAGGFWTANEVGRIHSDNTGTTFRFAGNIISDELAYTMGNPAHWTSPVSTVADALDQLAARLYAIENP